MTKIDIKEQIIHDIGKAADELGYEVYIVGGYVRDYYLGNSGSDFDFTVVGKAIDFAKKLAERFNSKAVVYPKFGTALVPIGEYKCEFVGTRKEEYEEDSRNPIVSEGTLEDDLRRRDFTVNAMAVSVNKDQFGEVIDLFEGIKDLDKKKLRTPLEPTTTFSDDPLRMMRAARFASKLNFKVDRKCIAAIKDMADRIKIISQERITDEFMKMLASPNPGIGLRIMFETGILEIVFPELHKMSGVDVETVGKRQHAHKDVLIHSIKVLMNVVGQSDNIWLRFAALVHDIAKPKTKKFIKGTGWSFHGHEELGARYMKKIFRRMKLPLDNLPYVEKLVRLHQRPMVLVSDEVTDSAIRRLAFKAGDALEDLFILCKADITTNNPRLSEKYLNNYARVAKKVMDIQEKDKLREFQSPVRGEEIMEICNLRPSRLVGVIKKNIEEAILDGIIPNEYEPAKEYFLENKNAWVEEYEKECNK